MSTVYRECIYCHAHNDPDERCDCLESQGIVAAPEPEDSDDIPGYDVDATMDDDYPDDGEGEDDG